MKEVLKEIVFTIEDWYDGALAGLANYHGHPHYYKSYWQDITSDDLVTYYWLTPLDAEEFQLVLEQWALWERWVKASEAGTTTDETHPTLPEDRPRHKEISRLLQGKPEGMHESRFKAQGLFSYGPQVFVEWHLLE
jgi:hypothetical protein